MTSDPPQTQPADRYFHLAPMARAHAAAAEAFLSWFALLQRLVRNADAIEHVGATSVPGCKTKGDLDIVVRVELGDFATADRALAGRFARNIGSACSDQYSPFICDEADPPLGVQLVVVGGEFDFFHRFRDALLADTGLVTAYNQLKAEHQGRSMEAYRAAKAEFVEGVLRCAAPESAA